MARPRPATPAEIGDGEDHPVDVNDPQVPPALRRNVVIEWWLLDAQGELIEAFREA